MAVGDGKGDGKGDGGWERIVGEADPYKWAMVIVVQSSSPRETERALAARAASPSHLTITTKIRYTLLSILTP